MSNTIGPNYFQKAPLSAKARIREFHAGILGWERTEVHPGLDIFADADERTYGVQYVEAADELLDDAAYRKSTWMSLRSEDRPALIARLEASGVTKLPEQSDENNYFFQAPNGQVYVA